ncbi:hypothetical protein ACFWU3_08520 [Streptomyces sp. NPDC058685]
MAYAAPGRPERALADLERALALDPDHAWALAQRERLRGGDAPG